MALRSAASEYVAASQVDTGRWNELFDFRSPYNDMLPQHFTDQLTSAPESAQEALNKTIAALLPQDAFDQIIDGGPFGREYQMYLARSYPGRAFLDGFETFSEMIKRRQNSWDDARPWSEGLATLFEVTLQEILTQFHALGEEAREAELKFVSLSVLQRIAYQHLVSLAYGEVSAEAPAKDRWPPLLRALDERGITPRLSATCHKRKSRLKTEG